MQKENSSSSSSKKAVVNKVPFKQTTKYGCGRYALANLFNSDTYLHVYEYSDQWDKRFQVLFELNECMHPEGLHVEYIYLTNKALSEGNRLSVKQSGILNPVDATETKVQAGAVVPLLVVYVNGNGKLHIAAMATQINENICHFIDSTEDEIIIGTPEWFAANYWIVGVATFMSYPIKNSNETVISHITSFPHIYG